MIMILLLVFPITFILLYCLHLQIKKFEEFKKIYDFSKTLPGPTLKELFLNAKRDRIISWFTELRAQHGKVFRIWFGKHLFVFFSDPDDVKSILNNNKLLNKSNNYKLIEPWLGKGLLTNGGKNWHNRRKMLTPAFHFKTLSAFKEPMEYNCDILISKLNQHVDKEGFDIYPYITLYALDVICETAMGIKKHAQMKCDSEYVIAVQKICGIFHAQTFSFFNRFEMIFKRTEAGKARKHYLEVLHNETNRVIELRRKMIETKNISSKTIEQECEDGEVGIKLRLAFLDMLLLAQKDGLQITDKEIREEVDTFMFEGHDTTSSAIAFTIYLLSIHKEIQEKAYEEIQQFPDNLDACKYLEAILKESLRLYPSVPFFSRELDEPLFVDNILLPKGCSVSVLAYMLHRNPNEFPEPDKFQPERYLNNDTKFHPYGFVAFSAGPRNCIGQKFALLELKCTLSRIIREFEILPVKNFKPQLLAELILKSENGIQIKLRKRK